MNRYIYVLHHSNFMEQVAVILLLLFIYSENSEKLALFLKNILFPKLVGTKGKWMSLDYRSALGEVLLACPLVRETLCFAKPWVLIHPRT